MKRNKPEQPPKTDAEQVHDLLTKLRQLEENELKQVNGGWGTGGRCAPGCNQ